MFMAIFQRMMTLLLTCVVGLGLIVQRKNYKDLKLEDIDEMIANGLLGQTCINCHCKYDNMTTLQKL